jgi:DNA (cytosine-5)-methyltransferase 1
LDLVALYTFNGATDSRIDDLQLLIHKPWEIASTKSTEIQKLIGNAVPSLLAEVLAHEINRQLLDLNDQEELQLIPPIREHTPSAEPVALVPPRYHELLGDHADHPGEGRGTRAIVRQ